MKGYVTKTGKKYHRDSCRFAQSATLQDVGSHAACAVCKPHLPAGMIPVKSVGKETLRGCTVCKASCADPVTRDEAPKLGYTVTPTGQCYHTATCKLLPANRTKSATSTKVTATKTIKPIKTKKNNSAVDASVMSALGM